MIRLILTLTILFLSADCFACNEYYVKQSAYWFFGLDYPYWFNAAQLQTESNCIWRTSLDGIGSVGYGQITPKYWDEELNHKGYTSWDERDNVDHFYAHAYILKKIYNKIQCKKLFIMYQGYNRSINKIIKECYDCDWKTGYEQCINNNDQQICVWKVNGICKQWKSSCDINYSYSLSIYRKGIKKQEWESRKYPFW